MKNCDHGEDGKTYRKGEGQIVLGGVKSLQSGVRCSSPYS